jgi:hypothetical protein
MHPTRQLALEAYLNVQLSSENACLGGNVAGGRRIVCYK